MFAVSWPDVHAQLADAIASDRMGQALGLGAAVVFLAIGVLFVYLTMRQKQAPKAARVVRSGLIVFAVTLGGTLFSMPFWQSLSDPVVVAGAITGEEMGGHGRVYLVVQPVSHFVLSAAGRGPELSLQRVQLPVTNGMAEAFAPGDTVVAITVGSGECVGYLDGERVVVP